MSLPRFPSPPAFLGDRPIEVVVVGAGGTGSMLLSGLGRLDCALRAQNHPGMQVTVYDPDTVSPSNVGRQNFATADIGYKKAVLMVHRINGFYGLDWKAMPVRYDKPTTDLDLLIGCVDSGLFRYKLGKACAGRHMRCLWLDTGNGAETAQIVCGHLGKTSGLRLPNVYDLFGDQLLAGDHDDQPSCSLAEALSRQRWSVNPLVAVTALTILDNLVHRGGLDDHGALLRLTPLTVTALSIDPAVWSMMGYDTAAVAA